MNCTCPEKPQHPFECLDCPEHGGEAQRECDAEQAAEIRAEYAWQNVYAWIVHDV